LTSVVVVSGSVRMEESEGAAVLAPFIEGMKAAGASVELVYIKRLKIKPCMGDFQCWDELPGQCRIKDDMQALYPKLRSADILVLATPVYVPLPGEMQNFMNRLVPLIDPYLLKRGDRTRARPNKGVRIKKIVLVSTCGWWEKGNFGTVVRIAQEFSKDIGIEFAGAVLRPHAQWLARENTKAGDVMMALRMSIILMYEVKIRTFLSFSKISSRSSDTRSSFGVIGTPAQSPLSRRLGWQQYIRRWVRVCGRRTGVLAERMSRRASSYPSASIGDILSA